jgi:transcriptional regulator with XRE-family HTH domain
MELRKRVAKNIRLKRLVAGWTQGQLAERLTGLTDREWSQSQISDLEHGRSAITLTTLEKIARALKCQATDLIQVPRSRDVAKLGPKADLVTFAAADEE